MSGNSQFGDQQSGFWLVVADQSGEELWQRVYGDERFTGIGNRAHSLIQDDDSGFLLGGVVHTEQGGNWFSVLRTDAEGERLWWRIYGEPDWAGDCRAVIELKSGEFVAVGRNGMFQAYVVMLNGDGDILWERFYDGGDWFFAIREVAGGLLMAGRDINDDGWLLKTNFEGEILWSRSHGSGMLRSLISCREGGFAASGHRIVRGGDWLLLRTDEEGNELWSETFDFGGNEYSHCLTQMWDNGFTVVGQDRNGQHSPIIRTDSAGNEQWRRIDGNEQARIILGYQSITLAPEGAAVVAGTGWPQGETIDGVLLKVILERSPPLIVFHSPEDLEATVLQGDTVEFTVRAEDMQDDSLSYFWTLDEDTASTDTTTTIIFEELEDHFVECIVSDGELVDSLSWLISVEEFFIRCFEPDSLELIIQRGTEVDFGIEVAAIEEIEVDNIWNLTHRDQRQEEIGSEDTVTVTFDQSGRHHLQALVTHEDESDEVTWTINVRSAIWSWWPSEFELTAYVDSTLEFSITPFDEESDSLEYTWLLNDEELDADTSCIELSFPEVNLYEVTSIVHDGNEADTIRWTVDVEEWSFTTDLTDLADLTRIPVLYPASPNPFNSSVKLSMYVPREKQMLLRIYDVNGREVARLVDGNLASGSHTFVWNAEEFAAGIYFAMMQTRDFTEMRKIVLIK